MPYPLGSAAWTHLRSFIAPKRGRDTVGPRVMADSLVATIDSEKWVPVPRFTTKVTSPAAGAGTYAAVQLAVYTLGGGVMRHAKFNLTDFRVSTSNALVIAYLASGGSGGLVALSNEATTGVDIQPFGPEDPHVAWTHGDAAAAYTDGPTVLGGENGWLKLPDVESGITIQFVNSAANTALVMFASWAERRPVGVDA